VTSSIPEFRDELLRSARARDRRRRRAAAGGALAVLVALAVVLPQLGGGLDAQAVAAEARRALQLPGVLHSVTTIEEQRIERWSSGGRTHTITYRGAEPIAEAVSDGKTTRVRMPPSWEAREIPGGAEDPLLAYRALLDRPHHAERDGDLLRLELGGTPSQVVFIDEDTHLPVRIELEGGAVMTFIHEQLPRDDDLLDFVTGTPAARP
jgi:hypothetical protein